MKVPVGSRLLCIYVFLKCRIFMCTGKFKYNWLNKEKNVFLFCFVLQNDSFFIGGLLRIGYKIENVSVKLRSPAQPLWVNGRHLTAHCSRAGSTLSVLYIQSSVVSISVFCLSTLLVLGVCIIFIFPPYM